MGVPKVCLKIILLNWKKVEFRMNLMPFMNSIREKEVLSEIKSHLLKIHSTAKSRGILVNEDMTSSETNLSSCLKLMSLIFFTNWKPLSIVFSVFGMLFLSIVDHERMQLFCKVEC